MSALPAANVKVLPGVSRMFLQDASNTVLALNMLLRAKETGEITQDTHTIVEYSSGSTVISLGILANIMGINKIKAYMSNKTSAVKLNLLRFFVRLRYPMHQKLIIPAGCRFNSIWRAWSAGTQGSEWRYSTSNGGWRTTRLVQPRPVFQFRGAVCENFDLTEIEERRRTFSRIQDGLDHRS